MPFVWSNKEQELFAQAAREYGKDYKQIAEHLGGSRTRLQVQNYTKNFIKRL